MMRLALFQPRVPSWRAHYRPDARQMVASLIFAALCFLMFCRGLLEVAMPKTLVQVLQFGGVWGLCSLLFLRSPLAVHRKQGLFLLLLLIFLFEATLSGIATSISEQFHLWPIYCGFTLGVLWIALIGLRQYDSTVLNIPIALMLTLSGWALAGTATAEQFLGFSLPGTETFWFISRPASLTGSILHYPIIIALLVYVALQQYALNRRLFYLISAVFFMVCAFISLSRSAVLIICTASMLLLMYRVYTRDVRALRPVIGVGILLVLLTAASAATGKESIVSTVVGRVTTASSSKAAGNDTRIRTWTTVSTLWLESNVLIGERTGLVTNSTRGFVEEGKSDVAESSVLQQLANFGLIGCLLYYMLLMMVFFAVPRQTIHLRCMYLGALAQSAVYQSIEVVPYITLLFMTPWIGHALLHQQRERAHAG